MDGRMSVGAQNDVKREEMKISVARLRAHGWTTARLATEMHVSAGTVGAWARGASMGTNAQRAKLAVLGPPVTASK